MKKIIMLLLPAILSVSAIVSPALAQDDEFSLAVKWAADNRIISADENGGLEAPDNTATRAEAAAMLARMKGFEGAAGGISYIDVKESDWFYADVCSASAAGLMTGDGDTFRPYDNVTREEAVVIAGRAFGLETEDIVDTVFTDSAEISDWAEAYIFTAAELGIVNGSDTGEFMPREQIKRRDLLLILYRCSRINAAEVIIDDDGSVWTPLY